MPDRSPSRWWRLNDAFLRLEGTNCQDCGVKHFPPRPICPEENCPSRERLIAGVTGDISKAGSEPVETTVS